MLCRTIFRLAAALRYGHRTTTMWKRREVPEDSDKSIYLFDRIGGQLIYRHRKSGHKMPLSDGLIEQRLILCVERDLIVHHQ